MPYESSQWLKLPLWVPALGGHELVNCFDGSFHPDTHQAGLALAIFIRVQHQWFQGGFLSTPALDVGSSGAELQAAIVAAKAAYGLVKLILLVQSELPEVWFGYDSDTVGNQLLGKWKCTQYPVLGDATHDLSHFLHHICRTHFVDAGEWMWMLFDQGYADKCLGHDLVLPSKPTTSPDITILPDEGGDEHPALQQSGSLDRKLATGNVLTLKSKMSGRDLTNVEHIRQATILITPI
eukprot:s2429_g18.t1